MPDSPNTPQSIRAREPLDCRINTRITSSMCRAIEAAADACDLEPSDWIREAIEHVLELDGKD